MNTVNPSDYFKRKAAVSNLSNAITDKRSEIEVLNRRIAEIQTYVSEINTKLAVEERELSRPWKLSRATFSAEQFREYQQSAAEMESELTVLHDTLAVRNRELTILQNDLGNKNSQFKSIRERTAEALADQVAQQIVDLAGEPITNLIHAMVASGGKHPEKELILAKLGSKIRDALYQGTPDWLPNLPTAKQHVEGQLHQLYLSGQGNES